MIKHLSLAIVFVTAFSSCTWIQLTPQGEAVRVVGVAEVADCARIGEVNARVLDKMAFMKRSRGKQATELANLARNEAGEMGADTIIAASDIEDGRRRFTAYRCN